MSLEDSFMQAYQKLSPEDKERLHKIIMKHLGEKLHGSMCYTNPAPIAPPRTMCPNCGTFINK